MIRAFASLLLIILLSALPSPQANAHAFRPALLDVARTAEHTWVVRWTVPAESVTGGLEAWIPVVPAACEPLSEDRLDSATAHVRTWVLECSARGEQASLRLPTAARSGSVVLTYDDGVERRAGVALPPGTIDVPFGGNENAGLEPSDVFVGYLVIGVEHILLGPDHLLFVLCLLLLIRSMRSVLLAVTGFTVGHSLTLVGATLGWVQLSSGPVEACIAASIVLLAAEAFRQTQGRPPTAWAERPYAVAAAFGLLHGFGFAGALAELGLPSGQQTSALLAFNVGVELGQVAFVAVAFPLLALARRRRAERTAIRIVAGVVGVVGAYWTWARVLGTLGLV